MKAIFLTFLFGALALLSRSQKIVENPEFGISNESNVRITRIEITPTETVLSFHLSHPPGSRFGIAEKSFIRVVGRPDTLFMTKKDAPEPDAAGWIMIPEGGISYKLYFPPIDPETACIDFGEPSTTSRPWRIYDLEINEPPHWSVIPKTLLGHWFSPEDGQWAFSFLDSLAVFDSQTWNYGMVTSEEKEWKIQLQNGTDQVSLYCQPDAGEYCLMRMKDSTPRRYSKDFENTASIHDEEGFTAPLIDPGKVIYRGVIRGFSPRLGVNTGLIRFMNRLNNQQESYVIPIQQDGSFSVEFPLDFPQEISVGLPSGGERLFFEPGKTLFHLANTGDENRPSLFMGESAAMNYSLKATSTVATSQQTFLEKIPGMDDQEYIDYVLETRKEEIQKLEAIGREQAVGDKVMQIRRMDVDFRAARNALTFTQNARMANFYRTRRENVENPDPFVPPVLNAGLLQKLNDVPVNADLAFCSNEYFSLLQSLKYVDLKHPQGSYYHRLNALADELKAKGAKLSGEENDMLEFVRLNLLEDYSDEKGRNFQKSYRGVLQQFNQKYRDELVELSNRFALENVNNNLLAFGFESEGLPVEMAVMQNYLARLKNANAGISETDFNNTKALLKTGYLKERVMAEYYRKKAEQEVREVAKTPELKTEGDRLFDSMIKKFRGKVVYVDFWATWCGPCRSGIERIKPLKQEMKDEDIVFVYITNPTSPAKTYKEMIPGIDGEHFKVSSDEWNYLTQKFNIYGIPHYALVDREGRVVDPHMMHLGNDQLKEVLMEQLKK